jgi:hypothetical protein
VIFNCQKVKLKKSHLIFHLCWRMAFCHNSYNAVKLQTQNHRNSPFQSPYIRSRSPSAFPILAKLSLLVIHSSSQVRALLLRMSLLLISPIGSLCLESVQVIPSWAYSGRPDGCWVKWRFLPFAGQSKTHHADEFHDWFI